MLSYMITYFIWQKLNIVKGYNPSHNDSGREGET